MTLLVIADDITGAAEMAGHALEYGCRVRFTTSLDRLDGDADVVVLVTDTRSMSCDEAVAVTAALVEPVRQLVQAGVRIFKKTDSALRGHIVAELRELMRAGFDRALLLPANPSKGRCIVDGRYLIDGVPIDQTLFRTDPEFPAATADVVALLGGSVHCLTPAAVQLEAGISIGESAAYEAFVQRFDAPSLLWAGAADAFGVLLGALGYRRRSLPDFAGLGDRSALIAFGSTARHDLSDEPFFRRRRVAAVPMPDAVFDGGACDAWIAACREAAAGADALLLRIPQQVQVDGAKARHLRTAMAETVAELVRATPPAELVIEGGATAYAILEALGWREFTVTDQIAPGVVRLCCPASGVHLIFKPGSYPWGKTFV